MKTKKLAAMLITVSMVLGSMSGLVWADTETDSTEPSTEQVTEITDETSEETESSEATETVEEIEVDEEEAEETEAPEEIDETIETEADEDIAVEEEGDVYEAEDADEYVLISTWEELVSAATPGPNAHSHVRLSCNINVTDEVGAISKYPVPGTLEVLDLNGKTIDMSRSTASDAFFFKTYGNLTIMNGELVGGHCSTGAGAIEINGGVLTLDDVKISGCSGNYGAIYIIGGTLKLVDEITIIENTSTNEGAGIRCNPYGSIIIDGTVVITNNYSDKSLDNYHLDNLYYVDVSTNFNPIVIGDNVNRGSYIRISGVNANTVITSGFNGRNYPDIFIFEDRFTAVVNNDGEVSSAGISYISRQWNGTEVEEVPGTILNDLTHITSDAFDPTKGISGTIYIYEDMVVADRIYVTEGETLNIVIADGVTLTCNGGIGVHSIPVEGSYPINSILHIYGQTNNDTGVLIASAPNGINCAGIGGSTVGTAYYDCGEVYISGCTVTATGNNAAGFGGITSYIEETETRNIVHGTNFQKVEIYGGNVTAIGGGEYGDDIGSGFDGACRSGYVSIYGGTVTLPHVGGYQIGLDYWGRLTLAPGLCVFNGFEYCEADNRRSICVSYEPYTLVISTCEHPNKADASLYTDVDDDTHLYNCPYCVSDSGIVQAHTFDNGLCICGHQNTETGAKFVGHAMQLSGQIGLQFYFNLPVGAEASDYRVYFLGNGIDETIEYTPIVSTKTTYGAYYVQLDLNPIQMADHFTPVLHLIDSTEIVAKGSSYCAMDYITWARSAAIVQTAERNLLEALADYGFYSQIYLSGIDKWTIGVDHEAINLGRNPTPYTRTTYLDRTQHYAAKVDPAVASCCDRVSLSLRCVDQLMLRVIFYPAEGQTFTTSDFSVLETSNISVYRRSDGAFVVTILDKISVMDVLDPDGGSTPTPNALYHVQVNNDSITGQVTVSPMSYAYTIISNLDNSQDCRNLVCAIYEYADECNAYRAQVTTN